MNLMVTNISFTVTNVASKREKGGRWELRYTKKQLPPMLVGMARKKLKLYINSESYSARCGVACQYGPGQYFWMNVRICEAGKPLKTILGSYGYGIGNKINVIIDSAQATARINTTSTSSGLAKATAHRIMGVNIAAATPRPKLRRNNSRAQLPKLPPKDEEGAKWRNVIDMGIDFSSMIRVFEKGSKPKIKESILQYAARLKNANGEKDYQNLHRTFCNWGIRTIRTAERKGTAGRVTKQSGPASYGQMAKIFDVVMHVLVYYSHYPDDQKAKQLIPWLNCAMDTTMMAYMESYYPNALSQWPNQIKDVDQKKYTAIQSMLRKFIAEQYGGNLAPVQLDDILWESLNRQS